MPNRIDSSRAPGLSRLPSSPGRAARGLLRGQSATVVARVPQAATATRVAADFAAHAAGPSADRPLAQRQVRREGKPGLASAGKQASFLRATGETRAASIQALRILRERRPAEAAAGRRNTVNRYLGTARALRALEPDIDDVHRLALLCPFRHAPETPRELFDLLENANPGALQEMAEELAAVDVLQRPPDRLRQVLESMRFRQSEVVAFLQKALGLDDSIAGRRYPGSAEEWAGRLETAGDDQEAAAILGEIKGLQVTPDLARKARQASRNPQELHRLLRHALGVRSQQEQDLSELRQALEDDLHQQELTDGDLIRASLAAGAAAADAAARVEGGTDANAFLDNCTDLLREADGFGEAARKVIAQFGLDNQRPTVGQMKEKLGAMRDMLEGMKQELGGELRSGQADRDKAHLGTVIRALSHLHVLVTLGEAVATFVASVESLSARLGIANPSLDAATLLAGLVRIVNSSRVNASHYEGLLKDMGVDDIVIRINVLQGVKQLLRSLPDKAYPDGQALPASIGAAQQVLDEIIRQEEELIDGRMEGEMAGPP